MSKREVIEEILNSVTSGVGLALAIAGLAVLVVFASLQGSAWQIVSCSIYGATLVLLYLSSTLYHSIPFPRAKRVFNVLDHSAIFLLIAGTYTPFTLVTLRGPWGWTLFGLVWGVAAAGIGMGLLFPRRFRWLRTSLYLAAGWIVLIAIVPLAHAVPTPGLMFLLVGGIVYTVGVAFYLTDHKLPFGHTIWHLFVIGGSTLHYFSVMFWVVL